MHTIVNLEPFSNEGGLAVCPHFNDDRSNSSANGRRKTKFKVIPLQR